MPSFMVSLLHTYAIKVVTALAGALIGYGALQSDQQAQLIQVVGGLLMLVATAIYSYVRQCLSRARVVRVVASAQLSGAVAAAKIAGS